MNKFLLLSGVLLSSGIASAQLGVGTNNANPKAVLDLTSTTRGFLIPRMTMAERLAIPTPPDGLMVYQTNDVGASLGGHYIFRGGAGPGAGWQRTLNTGNDVLTASNGLTKVGNDIQLGGPLTSNTTVAGGNFTTTFTTTSGTTGVAALNADHSPAAPLANGGEIFGSRNTATASGPASGQATVRAQVNQAFANSNFTRAIGSLNEAQATGTGLGAANTPQATGVTGLADYRGTAPTAAASGDFVVGVRGATFTDPGMTTNGINVAGVGFGGSYYTSVGGYFFPSPGANTLGAVSQVGGGENDAWKNPVFNGKSVAVVAMDAAAAAPMAIAGTNRAIYSNGNVQLSNLPATGSTALVGIDATGNLSSTTGIPASAVDNGLSVSATPQNLGQVVLGGMLNEPTTITTDNVNRLNIVSTTNDVVGRALTVRLAPTAFAASSSAAAADITTDYLPIETSGSDQGNVTGTRSVASTQSSRYTAQGAALRAQSDAPSTTGNMFKAIGAVSIGNGNNDAGGTNSTVVGVSGGVDFESGINWNGVGFDGFVNLTSTAGITSAGHFDGTGSGAGNGTEFGSISTIENNGFYSTFFADSFAGKHVAMAATNYKSAINNALPNQIALYTEGNVSMNNGVVGIGLGVNDIANSSLDVNASFGAAIATTIAPVLLNETNYTMIANASGITISFPAASAANARRIYNIVNTSAGAITTSSYNNFGAGSTTVPANSKITIQSDGGTWYRID